MSDSSRGGMTFSEHAESARGAWEKAYNLANDKNLAATEVFYAVAAAKESTLASLAAAQDLLRAALRYDGHLADCPRGGPCESLCQDIRAFSARAAEGDETA